MIIRRKKNAREHNYRFGDRSAYAYRRHYLNPNTAKESNSAATYVLIILNVNEWITDKHIYFLFSFSRFCEQIHSVQRKRMVARYHKRQMCINLSLQRGRLMCTIKRLMCIGYDRRRRSHKMNGHWTMSIDIWDSGNNTASGPVGKLAAFNDYDVKLFWCEL